VKTLRTLLVLAALPLLAGLGLVYSGLLDVAATTPDPEPLHWLLETTSERSIARHARGIAVPPLDDPLLLRAGIVHYQEMCVTCHGGPDLPASEIGQGLNPRPPFLGLVADGSPAELFWVIKNGIRMTGMPAFGPTHTDEQIWAMVAFVRHLPQESGESYQAELAAAEGEVPVPPPHHP
jgi:mono/diheme cytochrome c family protein